uniref:Uncharacterized protein n=1 Tax=Rhizophora mucronata TaxID=61149 RepID=A0A2P2P3L3_RHIMU
MEWVRNILYVHHMTFSHHFHSHSLPKQQILFSNPFLSFLSFSYNPNKPSEPG